MKTNMSYGEWLRNWINIYKKPYIKTWEIIRDHVRVHIPEKIKKLKLNILTDIYISMTSKRVFIL